MKAPPPPPPPDDYTGPEKREVIRRDADYAAELHEWAGDCAKVVKTLQSSVLEQREEIEELRAVLRGPIDEVERRHRPGLTAIVYELYDQSKRRQAVQGFMISIVSFLGVTNVLGLVWLFIRFVAGDGGP